MRAFLISMMTLASIALVADPCWCKPLRPRQQQESPQKQPQPADENGPSQWKIDSDHSSLLCAVSHYGLSFIYGRFNDCSGTVAMDFQAPDSTRFRFEIDPDSVDTNNVTRDSWLRGPQCLDVSNHDTITFESTKVESSDDDQSGKTKRTFFATGNLSLRGKTREITIPIELLAMGNGPEEELRCGFMTKFVVKRSDFGIDELPNVVGDNVAITFCFQAVRQKRADEESVATFEVSRDEKTENDFGKDAETIKLEDLFRAMPEKEDGDREIEPEKESAEDSEPHSIFSSQ